MITSLYGGLFGLLFLVLSVRALRLRRRFQVPLGPGDEPLLLKATRVHANFAEYVPLTLILIYLLEQRGAPALVLHLLCAGLLLGRVVHAWGVSQLREDYRFRAVGMTLTLTAMAVAALGLLGSHLGVA